MFPKKVKVVFAFIVAFIFLSGFFPQILSAKEKSLQEGWLWQILVYPPEAGWESEEGHSIKSALEYIAKEVNELHYGVQNHDIRFLYQPRILREDIYELSLKRFRKWKDLAVVVRRLRAGRGECASDVADAAVDRSCISVRLSAGAAR